MQLGIFLVSRGWLGTRARFFKELDREMSNKRRFYENFALDSQKYIKRSCPVHFRQKIKLCFCLGRL